MSKGTPAQGKRNTKNHLSCGRCGKMALHKQTGRCASCGYPDAKRRTVGSVKAMSRKPRNNKHLKKVIRKRANGFKQHPIIESYLK